MAKTKFYTATGGKTINIKNIALVESSNTGSALITLNVTDKNGKYIIIDDATPWAKAASKIEELSKS